MSFYCCEKFELFMEEEEFTVKEIEEILDFDFCPFCQYKLSMLS